MTQGSNGRTTGVRRTSDGDAPPGDERRTLSPDDALPPVEPPSAGFIIKLFVVPALIVAVVLGVVMCFQWLAESEASVDTYLSAIERGANNAWQCANDLAYLLRQDEKLRADAQVAQRLSKIAAARVRSGPPQGKDEDEIKKEVGLRVFLCKALGEMATPEAAAGLIESARRGAPAAIPANSTAEASPTTPELSRLSSDGEIEVRKAALEGVALLANNLQKQRTPPPPELLALALEASRESGVPRQRAIRERAAYALGVLGGDEAVARLKELVDAQKELQANVRFNAATGLARQGIADSQALAVLRDMIDPRESVAGEVEASDVSWTTEKMSPEAAASIRAHMEALIRFNGLSAVEKLASTEASFDAAPLITAIEALQQHSDTSVGVKNKAVEVRNMLQNRK